MHALRLKNSLEVDQLKELCRKTQNKRTAQRLRAIWLKAEGKTPREIAAILGRHPHTVRNWIKMFNDAGPSGLEYRHSGGRTGKLSQDQEQALARWLQEGRPGGDRWTLNALAQEVFHHHGVKISHQQIYVRILRAGLGHYIARCGRKAPDKDKKGVNKRG